MTEVWSGGVAVAAASPWITDKVKTEDIFDPNDNDLESVELDIEIDKDALAQLDDILQWMDSKIRTAKKITAGPPLSLKDDVTQRVAAARLIGADHFMSSSNMHKFLDMLLRLVARPSEASSRTWADTFLYRASAILPPPKQMVLNVEYSVSPVSVPTASGSEVPVGFIDYPIVVTNDLKIARYFLNHPGVWNLTQYIESVLGFFVVETKDRDVRLDDHIPQVWMQLYAAAKKLKCGSNPHFLILRKSYIRGTLTNGYEWLFLVLSVNPNGKGASYRISYRSYSAAPQEAGVDMTIPEMSPDMIAGILASWIEHSSQNLLEEDWFV
ncbi:hypothetical protein K443DRAFT_123702 [Laccaria amethystina LaAM-08-1]|uniref:Uncharacterized protein n=1 Tax=Laccaria amethystina LaAM-08-1 TaxID=1095629 RepID=A0A0C9XQR4_9AGAR|nr:hypothetical protein K443DRAFT_123702 [Laccaria amethystina LaAM-08-1]